MGYQDDDDWTVGLAVVFPQLVIAVAVAGLTVGAWMRFVQWLDKD